MTRPIDPNKDRLPQARADGTHNDRVYYRCVKEHGKFDSAMEYELDPDDQEVAEAIEAGALIPRNEIKQSKMQSFVVAGDRAFHVSKYGSKLFELNVPKSHAVFETAEEEEE